MQRKERTWHPRKIDTARHFINEAEKREGKAPSVEVPILYYDFVDRNRYNPTECRRRGNQ